MRSKLAFQIVDHATAIANWAITYMEEKGIDIEHDSDWSKLDFHLARLQAILDEIGCPLNRSPVVSEIKAPNGLLQSELSDLPNVDVTLPYVTKFIFVCY